MLTAFSACSARSMTRRTCGVTRSTTVAFICATRLVQDRKDNPPRAGAPPRAGNPPCIADVPASNAFARGWPAPSWSPEKSGPLAPPLSQTANRPVFPGRPLPERGVSTLFLARRRHITGVFVELSREITSCSSPFRHHVRTSRPPLASPQAGRLSRGAHQCHGKYRSRQPASRHRCLSAGQPSLATAIRQKEIPCKPKPPSHAPPRPPR